MTQASTFMLVWLCIPGESPWQSSIPGLSQTSQSCMTCVHCGIWLCKTHTATLTCHTCHSQQNSYLQFICYSIAIKPLDQLTNYFNNFPIPIKYLSILRLLISRKLVCILKWDHMWEQSTCIHLSNH